MGRQGEHWPFTLSTSQRRKPMQPPDWPSEHAISIGRVALAWNQASYAVYLIFASAVGLEVKAAWAAFWALKSDAGQRDVTLALVQSRLGDTNPLATSLKSSARKLAAISVERNLVVHTPWGITFLDTEGDDPRKWSNPAPLPLVRHPRLQADFAAQCSDIEVRLDELTAELFALAPKISAALKD